MTLGQNGRSATLTMLQKAGIYRKAMEEMRDHLEQVHVGYQRTDPDATYMIEGLVDIYEAMLRDFVVHGVPEDVGTPSHVKERFGSLTDEQRGSSSPMIPSGGSGRAARRPGRSRMKRQPLP